MSGSRILQVLALAALLLADLAPLADAHHHVQDVAESPLPRPGVPASSPITTGIAPVDRTLDGAFLLANRTEKEGYEILNNDLNSLRGPLGQPINSLPQPVRMYRDGAGAECPPTRVAPCVDPDARQGGFGPWKVVAAGSERGWSSDEVNHTARNGELVFATTRPDDGSYSFGANSMLLTPELDLRNGLVVEGLHRADPSFDPDLENAEFSAVWQVATKGGLPFFVPYFGTPAGVTPFTTPPDALYQFRFDARFNLAMPAGLDPATNGRDTVQVVALAGLPPNAPPPTQCSQAPPSTVTTSTPSAASPGSSIAVAHPSSCTLLFPGTFGESPPGGGIISPCCIFYPSYGGADATVQNPLENHYNARSVNGMPHPSFAGSRDWRRYTVDLTPWVGQTVRIGFWFQSGIPVGDLFFNSNAGFRGFQLDNLELTEHAPPVSVRVRPLSEPSLRPVDPTCPRDPDDAFGRCYVRVLPGRNFTVAASIVNMGLTPQKIQATVTVRDQDTGILVGVPQTIPPNPEVVNPGGSLEVEHAFPPLSSDNGTSHYYVATVTVDHNTYVDPGSPALPQGVDNDAGGQTADADPSDNIQELVFAVQPPVNLAFGPVKRSAPSVALGDPVRFSVPIYNIGILDTNFTADACLVDWKDYVDPTTVELTATPDCKSGPLDPSSNEGQPGSKVTFPLRVGENRTIEWTAVPPKPGQYKLFIHVQEGSFDKAANFTTVDKLLPGPQQPLASTYRSGPPPASASSDLNSDFWSRTRSYPISLSSRSAGTFSATGSDQATLQVANDDTRLYLRLALSAADWIAVRFDDRGDRKANGTTEDGARLDGSGWQDLHFDGASLSWMADQQKGGDAAKSGNVYEFIRPLNASGEDLSVRAGERVGLLIEGMPSGGASTVRAFPASASAADGGGLLPRNGRLDDEMRAWQPIRLASGPPAFGVLEMVTPGFGVDRTPPPFFQQDPSDCAAFGSWGQSLPTAIPSRTERWVCAPFGSDARPLLFEGTSPDSPCANFTAPCSQYSFSRAASSGTNLPIHHELYSPPLEVGDIPNPYLVLDHQFSTQVWVVDDTGFVQRSSNRANNEVSSGPLDDGKARYGWIDPKTNTPFRAVFVASRAHVLMETLDNQTGTWGDRVTLTPDDPDGDGPDSGYSTPRSVGLDPSASPLLFYGAGADFLPEGSGCLIGGATTPCAFWWPTGYQPLLRPPDAERATGAVFTGSPWRVDRFPLFGSQPRFVGGDNDGDFQTVKAADKTVRFVFQFYASAEPAPNDPYLQWVRDYGWRIGGLAVQEGPLFQRDLSVTNLTLDPAPLFDPETVGVGPGTTLHVRVGVRNSGSVNPGQVQVTLKGRDLASGSDVCLNSTTLSFTLAPGAPGFADFGCDVPPWADGGRLLLSATVAPLEGGLAGDDFPADNILAARQAYPVRAVRDVAALIDSNQRTGPVDDPRPLAMRVENRGNVPLNGIRVTQGVKTESGERARSEDLAWTLGGTLGVGESRSIEDLQPDRPLGSSEASFRPPVAGAYRVTLEALAPGDADPSNDATSILLRADETLYFNGIDGEIKRASGVVAGDGEITPTGVWRNRTATRVTPEGASVSTKVLRAGDPASGEIPAGTNAMVELPPIDLTLAKGATLSFVHRYELEPGFDAGRVEVSTDGGPWQPLVPDPAPLFNPDGYPSLPLLVGPLLDGQPEGTAVAFTGSSQALPGANRTGGWVKASFDLGRNPDLRRTTELDAFRLNGFAATPSPIPERSATGDNQFFDHSWDLEPDVPAAQRRWWIQEEAYDVAPHNGSSMWWSGGGPNRKATLDLTVPLAGCTNNATTHCMLTWWEWRSGWQDGDPAVRSGTGGLMSSFLRFRDADGDGLPNEFENNTVYPPGCTASCRKTEWNVANSDGDLGLWTDGEEYWAMQMAGAFAVEDPTDDSRNPIACDGHIAYDYESRGGSRCNTSLDHLKDLDKDGLLNSKEAQYGTLIARADSDGDGLNDMAELQQGMNPVAPDVGILFGGIVRSEPSGWVMRALDTQPYAGPGDNGSLTLRFAYDSTGALAQRALDEKSLGFFVSDVQLYRVGPQGMFTDPVQPYSPTANPGTAWKLVRQGDAVRDRTTWGWHVEDTLAPGSSSPTKVWRFGDGSDRGYPGGLDVRLVTPVVDLTRVAGDSARLQFDQRFGFASRCFEGRGRDACLADPLGFLRAGDGGAVEVQVFDEAHGTFGPWRQLEREFRAFPSQLAFKANHPSPDCNSKTGGSKTACLETRSAEAFADLQQRVLLLGTGYNAIVQHGNDFRAPNGTYDMPVAVPNGAGTSFEAHNGTIERTFGCGDTCDSRINGRKESIAPPRLNWAPFPVSYVFSGRSNGWQHVDWDLSPLVGQRVRFAFHVATTPDWNSSATYAGKTMPDDPETGWTVANVAVAGQVFQGAPVRLRLHLATDATNTKGEEWSVDDLAVAGAQYSDQLAVLPSTPASLLLAPGATATIEGRIANLGTLAQPNLKLVAQVDDLDGTSVEVSSLSPVTFDLGASGSASGPPSQLPFRLNVTLPPGVSGETTLRLQVRQRGSDGTYDAPAIESPGAARAQWSIRAASTVAVVPVPPVAGRSATVVAQPAIPHAGSPVTFASAVENAGTQEPDLTASWRFEEVLSKGSSAQRGTKEVIGSTVSLPPKHLGPLLRDAPPLTTNGTFTPPRPGLYRAHVDYLEGTAVRASAQLEVLVDTTGHFYHVSFANATQAATWADASGLWVDPRQTPDSSGGGGSSDPGWTLAFRRDGSDLLWGVDDLAANSQMDYCHPAPATDVCNAPVKESGGGQVFPGTVKGLEGVARSGPVDLSRIPQGQALLALENRPRFQEGDGFRLEAIPLRKTSRGPPVPAFLCKAGQETVPMSFALPPEAGFVPDFARSAPGTTGQERRGFSGVAYWASPNTVHPLDLDGWQGPQATPILGGDTGRQVTRFQLGQPAESTCATPAGPAPTKLLLANYTVQFVLHTGTRPGYVGQTAGPTDLRLGAQGLRVGAIDVTATGVELTAPQLPRPLEAGIQKEFLVQVRNVGQQADLFRISPVPGASLLPPRANVTVLRPTLFLEPGAAASVPYTVLLPGTAASGTYLLRLEARSASVASVADGASVILSLQPTLAPDLRVGRLAIDAPGLPAQVRAGEPHSLQATLFNLGSKEAQPVNLRFLDVPRALNATGLTRAEAERLGASSLGEVTVPRLCRAGPNCVGGGHFVGTKEWVAPDLLGPHTLLVVVDPEGRLAESDVANNLAAIQVEVLPAAIPDLEVSDLNITGLGPDGMAEEGGFLGVRATLTNRGAAPAAEVEFTLQYGARKLLGQTFSFAPGQSHVVATNTLAVSGNEQVQAAISNAQGETQFSNNARSQTVHARHHNLTLAVAPTPIPLTPGGQAQLQLALASTGNSVDRVRLRLSEPGWGLAVTPNPIVVAPDSTSLAGAVLQAPATAPAGDTVLHLRAEPVGNPGAAISVALRVAVAAVGSAPDLVVQAPATAPGAAALHAVVSSHSNTRAILHLDLAGLPWQAAPASVVVEPFANRSIAVPLAIPADAAPGTHTGLLEVRNATGAVLAQRTVQVPVLPRPDASAAWTGSILPGQADAGQRVLQMGLRVRNEGNVPLVATAALGALGPGLEVLGGIGAPARVPVRGEAVLPVVLRVAGDAPDPSDGSLEVWVRPAGGGPDALAQRLDVRLPRLEAAPDLLVARIDRFPAGPQRAGDAVQFRIQVVNQGPVAAPPSRLRAFVNGALLDDPPVPEVPPGASLQVNVTATFGRAGTFLLTALADGEGGVPELQEANNGAAQAVLVQEPPLVSAHSVRRLAPALVAPGGALPCLLAILLAAAWAGRRREEGA